MGVFDRLLNLGRGKVRTLKRGRSDVLSDEELEAELASVRAPVVPQAETVQPPEQAEPEDHGVEPPLRDADGKVIKTL